MNDYDDIINMNRPISKREKMNIIQRANIFNPFAALTGYAEAINEAGRIVEKKEELTEDKKADLDIKLKYIMSQSDVSATIIYFKADKAKNGGVYKSISGKVKKINLNDKIIKINDLIINFCDLYQILLID